MKTKIIGEIGLNHNGDIDIAKKLIDVANTAGCNFAKFQKRNPEVCVPDDQKEKIRETPWGKMTYLDYKRKIEFQETEFDDLYEYVRDKDIEIFASVWDKDSVDFMSKYTDIMKIPSALITDLDLCSYAREKSKTLLISTGMSTQEEIDICIKSCSPDVIFHTNSTYPCPVEDLNLRYITTLLDLYPDSDIGYSGHEYGLATTFATVSLGATWIERHVTLDRNMWGSDQKSSVEPSGLFKLVKGIRDIEQSLGSSGPRVLTCGENSKRESLRKVK